MKKLKYESKHLPYLLLGMTEQSIKLDGIRAKKAFEYQIFRTVVGEQCSSNLSFFFGM